MMWPDPNLEQFFSERKERKLKTKNKKEVDEEFYPENWLPKAANRAGQMSFSTHPCGFSHPSSAKDSKGNKTTAIIAEASFRSDGYLRSGNVVIEEKEKNDAFGNAAAMDVYQFLTLVMDDGQPLIDHIEKKTKLSKAILDIKTASYEELRDGFLMIKSKSSGPVVTHSKIKQVYFPVEEGKYHLLSILAPSGLMSLMFKRIKDILFSEETKTARDLHKNNQYSETGYCKIYGLARIGHGGTKPQNISVFNKEIGQSGFYLLSGLPPTLSKQNTKLPRKNFFSNCLWRKEYNNEFIALNKLFKDQRNNKDIHERRDRIILNVFDQIVEKIWAIRSKGEELAIQNELTGGWSSDEKYSSLPLYQKCILDNHYHEQREEHIEEFLKETSRWLVLSYEKTIGKNSVGDIEMNYIKDKIIKKESLL